MRRSRLLSIALPIVLVVIMGVGAAGSSPGTSVPLTGARLSARCSCVGVATVDHAMRSAALVAIASVDTTAPEITRGDLSGWRIRIERAWRWPGGRGRPPAHVVVYSTGRTMCDVHLWANDRHLVVAYHRGADSLLFLGSICTSPHGPVDTLGYMAALLREHGGDSSLVHLARRQAIQLEALRVYGPGLVPPR